MRTTWGLLMVSKMGLVFEKHLSFHNSFVFEGVIIAKTFRASTIIGFD